MFRDFTEQGNAKMTNLYFEYLCSAFERVKAKFHYASWFGAGS